jgi:hypothetical protein
MTKETFNKLMDAAYFEVRTLAKTHNWDIERIMEEEDFRFEAVYKAAEEAGFDTDNI